MRENILVVGILLTKLIVSLCSLQLSFCTCFSRLCRRRAIQRNSNFLILVISSQQHFQSPCLSPVMVILVRTFALWKWVGNGFVTDKQSLQVAGIIRLSRQMAFQINRRNKKYGKLQRYDQLLSS